MSFFKPLVLSAALLQASLLVAKPGVVIAHRSSTGYLPEHTLEGVAMSHAFGVDFIEPDVVLTSDNVPIVLHDIFLDTTTNVAKKYPKRKRSDGRWYAVDFSLSEIKSLSVHERIDPLTGKVVYPKRFPLEAEIFKVPTLEEDIKLIQGLNKSTGRVVGLYPEIKDPEFHMVSKKDIAKIVYNMLVQYGYDSSDAAIYIQCFNAKTLRYLKNELKSKMKQVQLIGDVNSTKEGSGFKSMLTEAGVQEIAKYANAVAPSLSHILVPDPKSPVGVSATKLVAWAHSNKLQVHAYTLRADELPPGVPNFQTLLKLAFDVGQVDGVFTDFPDLTLKFLNR